ncbi:MAG TPA: hypothetical protein VFR58_16500 [Flavisolibacter sp.]|nr:hypothetical protein [Flavisolibacter sp.]
MSQTVVGFFDDASDAQRALGRLQSSGISRDRVDLSGGGSRMSGGTAGSPDVNPVSGSSRDENSVRVTSDDRTVDREGRNTNKITDFFNNLFGGHDKDNDDAKRYGHVAGKSNTIVTVHAQSREEAERAADILDECGAVDVDERSTQYGFASSRNAGMGNSTERSGSGMRSRSFIVDRSIDDSDRLRDEL